MPDWRQPPVGQVPHDVGPEDTTPPHGMVRVLGVRMAPPPRGPVQQRVPTALGMPAPPFVPPAAKTIPELDPDDEPTEPGSLAYRLRRLVIDFEALSDFDRRRVERHIQALLRVAEKKR